MSDMTETINSGRQQIIDPNSAAVYNKFFVCYVWSLDCKVSRIFADDSNELCYPALQDG